LLTVGSGEVFPPIVHDCSIEKGGERTSDAMGSAELARRKVNNRTKNDVGLFSVIDLPFWTLRWADQIG